MKNTTRDILKKIIVASQLIAMLLAISFIFGIQDDVLSRFGFSLHNIGTNPVFIVLMVFIVFLYVMSSMMLPKLDRDSLEIMEE